MQYFTMSFKKKGESNLRWVDGAFDDNHPNPAKELRDSEATKRLLKDGYLIYGGPMVDKTILEVSHKWYDGNKLRYKI